MKAILAKLHLIMKDVDFIAKDKTNDFHKYNYASEQAIKEKLHALLVHHGVLFILSSSNIRHTGTLTDIDCIYKFYDVASGECLEGTFVGTGEDKLDKGTYKAITGALKYILTSTFLIPTGDDPEKTPTQSKAPAKPTYQKSASQPPVDGKLEYNPKNGDVLKTGNKNGKNWYGIKHGNNSMSWITAEQYQYLYTGEVPLPTEE